ncbi:MAG: hypothetical protein E6I26_05280 [Chloroflexi bacterium]|nr:MAG: hypothetical protein E6I26_05280 [Chloroflexota bacterium]
MLKTAARILLLRILPGRLIPIVTVAEAILLIRSVRRRSRRPAPVAVNDPRSSRSAPPEPAGGLARRPPPP